MDDVLLGQVMFKATAQEDAGRRIIFLEASNENTDLQHEQIAHEALWSSRDYYLAHGNLDIDHISKIGPRMNPPMPDYYAFEIGRPVAVDRRDKKIYVKGALYAGNEHADRVWKSLTEYEPPQPWFASVAGAVLARETKNGVSRITKCRWSNVAVCGEAVNHTLSEPVSTMPMGPFAKGFESVSNEVFAKALMAGYGSDTAGLTGGGALRHESLHGARIDPYARFKQYASKQILKGGRLAPHHLNRWAMDCGASEQDAPHLASKFLKELLGEGDAR